MSQKEGEFCYYTEVLGQFRFTDEGLKELRSYFAKAGININTIKTKSDYYAARRACSHFLLEHLTEKASRAKYSKTLEGQALIAAVSGDDAKLEMLLEKLDRRNKLGFKVV